MHDITRFVRHKRTPLERQEENTPLLLNVKRRKELPQPSPLSFFKGGVWAVKGNRAFLLVPQPSHLGAQRLELRGDWLFIYGELEEPDDSPDVRYNRRTHELRYAENFW